MNLFATLNDFDLKQAEDEDAENVKAIVESAQAADDVVYAAGVGKAKSKTFQKRQRQVLEALRPYEAKLRCLINASGKARLQHPLSPAVRTWYFSPLKISELIPEAKEANTEANDKKETKRGRKPKKESSPS